MGGTIVGICDRCGLKIDIDPMRDPEGVIVCDDCTEETEKEEKAKCSS